MTSLDHWSAQILYTYEASDPVKKEIQREIVCIGESVHSESVSRVSDDARERVVVVVWCAACAAWWWCVVLLCVSPD